MSDIQIIHDNLEAACCPEDIFGSGDDPSVVFKKLARVCHPDRNPTEPIADNTFKKLNELKQVADERVRRGIWGKRIPLPHCVPLVIGKYKVKPHPRIGDIADLYTVEGGKTIVKVAKAHDDNDLLRAEADALRMLADIDGPVRDGVPELIDTFWAEGTWKREANVITRFTGFVTAQEVCAKFGGATVDKRTGVWMFKRILSLLSWVHHFKLVHGAILPPHIMFYPDNDGNSTAKDPRKHSIRMVDWCYSVNYTQRTRLSSWVPAWQDFYPPELLAKKAIGPFSDIYMSAKLIIYLCGTLWMPDLGKILIKCIADDHTKRYQKASDVLDDWTTASIKAYGTPKWIDFNLP